MSCPNSSLLALTGIAGFLTSGLLISLADVYGSRIVRAITPKRDTIRVYDGSILWVFQRCHVAHNCPRFSKEVQS
jgi:hypothetical protein